MAELQDAKTSLPGKVVVTLKAGGIFFAIANIICVAMIVWGYLAIKLEPKTLQVTGSARKAITSDRVTWNGRFIAHDPSLVQAYEQIKVQAGKVREYLLSHGIAEGDIKFSAISTERRFEQKAILPSAPADGAAGRSEDRGQERPTLITTEKVEMYTLSERFC